MKFRLPTFLLLTLVAATTLASGQDCLVHPRPDPESAAATLTISLIKWCAAERALTVTR